MEKFLNLPKDKQNTIIDAALNTFSTNGYKKASVSDIAGAAGISKAMIFHYFGTKKSLYFYLIDLCSKIIMDEIDAKFDTRISDFFDRIRMSTEIEISVMKKHPAIPAFLTNMYFENDEEVKEDIKVLLTKGEDFRNKIAFDGMDISKFKDSVDVKLVMKMLTWIADGYANQLANKKEFDFDALYKEFDDCLIMLKNNLYKNEYLNE